MTLHGKALKSYIHSLLAFKHFTEVKRRKDRQRLNTQRKRLLMVKDGEFSVALRRCDDKAEFQGFRYDGKPLGNEERVVMENPTAEFEVARKMLRKMARTRAVEGASRGQSRDADARAMDIAKCRQRLPQRPSGTTDLGSASSIPRR